MVKKEGGGYKWGEAHESNWIDISIPFRTNMWHWPTDPPARAERIKDRDKGDPVSLMEIQWVDHTGTHVDAPLHFIAGGKTIDEMPLDATIGRARVIEIKDTESINPEELAPFHIRHGERILFKTINSSKYFPNNEFFEDYVYISPAAAHYLVERGIRVVGIDYISVGSYRHPEMNAETHKALLNNGIYIIEGLDLSRAKAGRYELICLPIWLERGDAGSARAIVRPV
ncbi:cyclase family protein [Chloroflexota bacterium]